jgi:hypothetical protein
MARFELEPALAEEALVHVFDGASGERALGASEWRRERDGVYALPAAQRAAAFRASSERWSRELDLIGPIRRALAACPHASRSIAEIQIRAAVRARDQGSELFAPPNDTGAAVVGARWVLSVHAELLADRDALFELALRELLYADDMLDPAFGHRLALPIDAGLDPVHAELAHDRFRVLWEARILGRVARELGHHAQPQMPSRFCRAFGASLDRGELASLYDDAWHGRLTTQAALLERASTSSPAIRAI